MLKRLRIRLTAVIMLIVTVMLFAIFGLLIYFTKSNTERESLRTLRAMASVYIPHGSRFLPYRSMTPDRLPDTQEAAPYEGMWKPLFTVQFEKDGRYYVIGSSDYDLKDASFIQELLDDADKTGETIGLNRRYHLRWVKGRTQVAASYVFADISDEDKMILGLVRNCVLIGAAAWLLFLILSLFLVRQLLRPTAEAIQYQKEFIADASHELKTPLTVIMSNAEMMTESSFDESTRRALADNILKMSVKMRGLVESMLELARLDASTAQPSLERLNWSELVQDVLLTFEPLYYENDRMLESDIAEQIFVSGDSAKLSQVAGILLDNALKYSEEHSTVRVTLRREHTHCILTVSSQGTPLSHAECKHIFKRFYRVDQSRNDRSSYGLGLSIAQSIVDAHKGTIWAESEGNCNLFRVSLSLAEKG